MVIEKKGFNMEILNLDLGAEKLNLYITYPKKYNSLTHIFLLVPGANTTALDAWSWGYMPQLQYEGFIAVTFDLPFLNTGNIYISSIFLQSTLAKIIDLFPDNPVHIVAHSMGNMVVAAMLKKNNFFLVNRIESYIAIGAFFHGAYMRGVDYSKPIHPSLRQSTPASNFVEEINRVPFPDGIRYYNIISESDDLSTYSEGSNDLLKMAMFPNGTHGSLTTPQKIYNKKIVISHINELADNAIYRYVIASAVGIEIAQENLQTFHYPLINSKKYNDFLNSKNQGSASKTMVEPKSKEEN